MRTFLALNDFKFDLIAFSEAFVTFRRDRAVVNKHIGTVVPTDESITLGVVKPLHSTFQSIHLQSSSVRAGGEPRRMPNPVETAHDGRRNLGCRERHSGIAEVGVEPFSAIVEGIVKLVTAPNSALDAVFERAQGEYIASRCGGRELLEGSSGAENFLTILP